MVYAILLICLIIGVPVAFSIVAALMYFMAVGEFPYHLRIVATQMFGGIRSYPLLAIPLFILAGELMNESGITSRIIAFTNVIVGRLRAGLALVNIWASVIFAGLSGSAVADTSAIGRVFIPEMEKRGYPRDFSAAITAASSVIGPIIPPSIPVIIYALIVTGVSVPGMFLGGVIPGILLAIFLSVYVMIFAGKYQIDEPEKPAGSKRKILVQGIIPLLMPVFVVGTILFGVVTPTEAASFAVAYALIVGLFLFREIKWTDLPADFWQLHARQCRHHDRHVVCCRSQLAVDLQSHPQHDHRLCPGVHDRQVDVPGLLDDPIPCCRAFFGRHRRDAGVGAHITSHCRKHGG